MADTPAPTLEERIAQLEADLADRDATLERERTSFAEERGLFALGVTDAEALGVARHFHDQLPKTDRPALAAWVGDLAKDPAKAPKALRPYLPAAASGEQKTPAVETKPAVAPRTLAAVRPPTTTQGPPAGAELSAEQAQARIGELAADAQRTGNWSAYNAERATLLARISRG